MSVKSKSVESGRRGFLKGVVVAGSAAAVTAVSTTSATAAQKKEGPASAGAETTGYRETPHILEYYEKARF